MFPLKFKIDPSLNKHGEESLGKNCGRTNDWWFYISPNTKTTQVVRVIRFAGTCSPLSNILVKSRCFSLYVYIFFITQICLSLSGKTKVHKLTHSSVDFIRLVVQFLPMMLLNVIMPNYFVQRVHQQTTYSIQ